MRLQTAEYVIEDKSSIVLVQLPFPSQADPADEIVTYYKEYMRLYQTIFPTYFVREGALWEAPLWVAHLDGAIGQENTLFLNLSQLAPRSDLLSARLLSELREGSTVFLSPLAQNFALAREVSRTLLAAGFRTVIGGNMADLADERDFSIVYRGLARAGIFDEIRSSHKGQSGSMPMLGRRQEALGYRPNYRYLADFASKVPLVRLNASHGCLFGCTFCGDAWSRQLHVVPYNDLKAEFDEILERFGNLRVVYIGDKTFGQSEEAVRNLISVTKGRTLDFIVQTHVQVVTDSLIDQMETLGVKVVEIGFETADPEVLRKMKKAAKPERYLEIFEKLNARGIRVILNVLGGLPYATAESHHRTIEFLTATQGSVFLHNLYNFVPYPKTPIYPSIKSRIVDWEFAHWREDFPVVFEPFHQSIEQSWQQFIETVAICTDICRKKCSA
ncbi:B12-binding domain-containing radical SAM protein [Sinorhizobium medicae]